MKENLLSPKDSLEPWKQNLKVYDFNIEKMCIFMN